MTIAELKAAIALAQTLDQLPDETLVVVQKWGGDDVIVESAQDPHGDEWVLVIKG